MLGSKISWGQPSAKIGTLENLAHEIFVCISPMKISPSMVYTCSHIIDRKHFGDFHEGITSVKLENRISSTFSLRINCTL